MSTSPLVRRLRLGVALKALREKNNDISAEALAKSLGWSRPKYSRLETDFGRKPDIGDVMTVLERLGLHEDSPEYKTLVRVARDAAASGWWEERPYAKIGPRLARLANLENGARVIRQFSLVMLPGLVQTPAMERQLAELAIAEGDDIDLEMNLAARKRRQEVLTDPGTNYELIVEELVIRRLVGPGEIQIEQLEHLLALRERPNVSIRVMPISARLEGLPPRTPFGIYSYADTDDPTVITVDTVTEDILITSPNPDADRFVRSWERLQGAALSADESAAFIRTVVSSLGHQARP